MCVRCADLGVICFACHGTLKCLTCVIRGHGCSHTQLPPSQLPALHPINDTQIDDIMARFWTAYYEKAGLRGPDVEEEEDGDIEGGEVTAAPVMSAKARGKQTHISENVEDFGGGTDVGGPDGMKEVADDVQDSPAMSSMAEVIFTDRMPFTVDQTSSLLAGLFICSLSR